MCRSRWEPALSCSPCLTRWFGSGAPAVRIHAIWHYDSGRVRDRLLVTTAEHCELNTSKYESYRFWAGSQSVAVMIRRLGDVYVITGTLQPQSNFNEAPLSQDVEITIPNATDPASNGTKVAFNVRRQGSMFVLNDTLHPRKPVLRQLDEWHEATHFLRWHSKKFALEAELHDDHAQRGTEALHTGLAPAARHDYDFVGAVTYTELADGDSLDFTVSPRPVDIRPDGSAAQVANRRYAVHVRARSQRQSASLLVGTGSAAIGSEFGWVSAATARTAHVVELPTGGPATVSVTALGGAVEFDALQLVEVRG